MSKFWKEGNAYKFKVVDEVTKALTIYTGVVIQQDEERLEISDLHKRDVVIQKKEIKRSVRI